MKIMSLLLAGIAGLSAHSAFAAFACGPHFETYEVYDANLSLEHGTGVRCVHFVKGDDSSQFVWYGEGAWGNFTYRHLGDALHFGGHTARAVDVFGNGEDGHGVADLRFVTSSNSGLIPALIRVTSPWAEVWMRAADGVAHDYTSTLRPIDNCGANLTAYTALAPIDLTYRPAQTNIGTRCKFPGTTTWIGQGIRNGAPYFHVGTFVGDGYGVGAFDICPDGAHICGAYDFGALRLESVSINRNDDFLVRRWDEQWEVR